MLFNFNGQFFLLTIRHFDESLFFSNFLFHYPFWSGKIRISY
nr:MAG TPA: hypothetical protein [Herelleviridae sp.]